MAFGVPEPMGIKEGALLEAPPTGHKYFLPASARSFDPSHFPPSSSGEATRTA
jgi:hypothetical protein